jgi:hypothetical protein
MNFDVSTKVEIIFPHFMNLNELNNITHLFYHSSMTTSSATTSNSIFVILCVLIAVLPFLKV